MGYGYDTNGRLASVTEPGIDTNGFAAVFGYVPNSDLPFTTASKVGTPNGTRGYDAADRLTSIGYARPGNTVVTSHGYVLDAADCPFALRNDLGSRFAFMPSLFARCQCRTRAEREDGTASSYNRGDGREPRWIPRMRNPKGETSAGRERVNYNDRDEKRRGTKAKPEPEGRGPRAGGPSQGTSAVKLLPGEELLAGWQQSFDYDNLGNRKWTFEGGNAAGANRRETVYTRNALNQYTEFSHPYAFSFP